MFFVILYMKFMNRLLHNKTLRILVLMLIVALVSGTIEHYRIIRRVENELSEIRLIRAYNPKYPLINPILSYDLPEFQETRDYIKLKDELNEYIAAQIDHSKAESISVYFRDLNTIKAIDVHPEKQYTPASLFKLPLLMTYLRAAETDPTLLSQKVIKTKTTDENSGQAIKSAEFAKANQPYTVEELLRLMIVHSDNNAALMLFNAVNKEAFQKIFTDFQLHVPDTTDRGVTSPKEYSFFLRILYNASYLGEDMSEKALRMLSEVEFKDGIVKGVPENTLVAHKFGEFSKLEHDRITWKELHDCGIVYYPNHPYFLCVMTKGQNLDELKQSIGRISELVYNEVRLTYPQ